MRTLLAFALIAFLAPPCAVTSAELVGQKTAAASMDGVATAEGVAFFEKHIRPLLMENCHSCHSREKKQKGGLLLDSRAGWLIGGDRGAAIIPGDVDSSLLMQAVRYGDPDLQMPPDDKQLSREAVALLELWVKMGAPDPRDGRAVETGKSGLPSDPVAGREHWAFRPLGEQPAPAVQSSHWPRSLIDAFVLEKLEAAGLTPAPDADRRTLLRRVYFQLIGLPPTPEQVANFLADERTDAYERVVDWLLAAPQFGERWGRHWLDLARYADSNGLDENFLFREAWRYRNWVIAAVNADVPFDRFLTEQIAGDLLPFDSIEQRDRQRIAAGFLVIGPKVLLGNDANQRLMDVADEQVDTVGRAILGQTLGCARCHDHKFDPVPTADYYALAGIFTSTQVMEDRYMLNEQRTMERLVGLNADGDELNNAYETYWRGKPKKKDREKQSKSDGPSPKIPPRAMIPADAEKPADESIRLAGQFDRLGRKVPRGFLQVISDMPPNIPKGQSGRLQLAHWLTDIQTGAGHLAARVLVNRVWHHLFGRGLVRTVDNFGRTGEAPSHPELLDYLARQLIDSGWSLKQIVRQIVLARTFILASCQSEAASALDPDNRWFGHASRRRLEPEALRDAMLSAAGQLDLGPMDSTVSYMGDQATDVGANKNRRRTDFPCRSVYLPVIRNDLPELFDVFDFANPQSTTGMRPQTMVATQALFMLNDASVMAAAEATARRVLGDPLAADDEKSVNTLFELMFNAPPLEDERAGIVAFVRKTRQHLKDEGENEADLRAWSQACQALFASSRFQILE